MWTNESDTPALILDMDIAERNIKKMAEYFNGKKVSLRPHIKVHKSPLLAHKQVAAGARGITCATIHEAEMMARSGIDDILIANEIADDEKLRKIARLTRYCRVIVLVDDLRGARQLSKIAVEENSHVGVLLDINLNSAAKGILDRCGVRPGPSVVSLAHELDNLKNVKFCGLMGYEGALGIFVDFDSKKNAAHKALRLLIETRDEIKDSGVDVEVVSSGGTMSYKIAAEFPGVTEVQAGGYAFSDTSYRNAGIDFEIALTVATRVISKPRPDKIVVDAGYKAISAEHGLPAVKGMPGLIFEALNAEHGHITVRGDANVERGDLLELLPSHVDTTVCLHDKYIVRRGEEVESELRIPSRNSSQ